MFLGQSCEYNPLYHRIIENSQAVESLKRDIGDADLRSRLFLYYHTYEKTWVIALWTHGKHAFVDVLNIGKSMNNLTREAMQNLLLRLLHPTRSEDTRQFIRDAESRRIHNTQDESDEESEFMQYRMNPTGRIAVAI